MAQTPPPKYEAGKGETVHASAALTGGRLVSQTTTAPNGGNRVVGVPSAGGAVCGVMGEDAASGAKGLMWRPGQTVWVEAAATLTPGDVVQSTNTGTADVRTTGIVVGQVVEGATVGNLALIDLRPVLIADAT